jgi:hypothetical protein
MQKADAVMKIRFSCLRYAFFVGAIMLDAAYTQEAPNAFKYRIAIVGSPSNPDIRYDDSQMKALKALGFNSIQLNISWGTRPKDEPLNLEDVLYVRGKGRGEKATIDNRLANLKRRAIIAKRWGFRTLFHVGIPNVYYQSEQGGLDALTEKYSIQKKEIIDLYVDLLKRLKQEVPELDDIEVYTFDQNAWIGSEFTGGPLDRDVPLSERLPAFLQTLTETWASVSPEGYVWWEPWELSAGQIYAMIPELPARNFGLFMHSNISEVQLTRPVDVWFRNMSHLLKERNIPFVGEIFMASNNEEVESLNHIAAPRLVAEEMEALHSVEFIDGVKEYYGFVPDIYDPNLIMAGMKLKNVNCDKRQALRELAGPYGEAAGDILHAWESSAVGLAVFPWDATWRFRRLAGGNATGVDAFHPWDIAHIEGNVAESPSWRSTRRSLFMITESEKLHPWLFEDIELRCASSSQLLQRALEWFRRAQGRVQKEPYAAYIDEAIRDLQTLEQAATGIRCYCRESNLALLMRNHLARHEEIPQQLIDRFEVIMQVDVANQAKGYIKNRAGYPTAEEVLTRFTQNPAGWVSQNLLFK